MSEIAVVILNWNGHKLLDQFLPSVVAFSQEATVYMIDNGSTDDSVEFVQTNFPSIKIITLKENNGFCQGYNLGLEKVEADYYVLLNSDVEVTENWLQGPISLLKENSNIAACQPKIKSFANKKMFEYAGAGGGYLDHFGFPFCRGRLFDTLEEDKGQYNHNAPIHWASGASLFIKSSIFHELNGFDTSFFAHMEEIDLCWRINNIGKEIWYCSDSEIYHVGGGTLQASNPQKTYYNFRNGLALLYKNTPKGKLFKIIFTRLILDGVAGIYFLFQGNPRHTLAVFNAHIAFYSSISKWKKVRKQTVRKRQPKIILQHSIVYDYFIKGLKTFDRITF